MTETARYFVTVHADDRAALRQLADFHLDLFQGTARLHTAATAAADVAQDSPHIEGLMTLAEVGRLVESGYRVTVEATEASRSRATRNVIDADTFLRSMGV